VIEALAATAARRATPEAAEWLRAQIGATGDTFYAAFGAAARRIGATPITRDDAARIADAGLFVPAGMGADECARGALLLSAVWALPTDDHVAFVRDLLKRGDARERSAILRVFAGLPDPARFTDIAADACRTNVASVLEAIACDNDYPMRWFADDLFDQMVEQAKALHLPLAKIRMRSLMKT
jgi:hypothetical protein